VVVGVVVGVGSVLFGVFSFHVSFRYGSKSTTVLNLHGSLAGV
jgi:hypothetical protein